MALRIAVGGFLHESTTFVDQPTTWDDFARSGAWPGACEGDAMLKTLDGLNMGISGFVDEVRKAGHTIVPTTWAMAQPAGPVTAHAFERMSAALVDGYRRSGADVIFVELHGAMVAEGYDDAEGGCAGVSVRPSVRRRSSERSTCTSTCRTRCSRTPIFSPPTAPIRMSTGARPAGASRWLDRMRTWGTEPAAHAAHAVLIPVTAGCSMISPAKELYETWKQSRAETGVHLNFTPGFPPADIATAVGRVRLWRRPGDRRPRGRSSRRCGDCPRSQPSRRNACSRSPKRSRMRSGLRRLRTSP